jgi:hypothetical protein
MPYDAAARMAELNSLSAAKRGQFALVKRGLKSGTLGLADALEHPVCQDRAVLEVLGYALIGAGNANRYRGNRPPQQAGMTALRVARSLSPPVGHFTLVAHLSATRRAELVDAAARSGQLAMDASDTARMASA